MSAQTSGLMRCNEGERHATGEFLAFAITCSGTDFIDMIRKGAPIVQVAPADFPALGYFYLGVPKNAPHPNAGKLYALFCMTPEGQKLMRQTWDTDMDLFPETGSHKQVADLEEARGTKFDRINIAWYDTHPEAYEAWKQIVEDFHGEVISRVFARRRCREHDGAPRQSRGLRVMHGRGDRGERGRLVMLSSVLWLGFRVGDLGDPAARYSLGNYRDIFGDARDLPVLADTLRLRAGRPWR